MKYQIKTLIQEKEILPGGYARIAFDHRDFARACKAGQFLSVRTNTTHSPLLRRPFGVHDVDGERVSILVKIIGPGTEQLAAFKAGDTIDVLGPLGKGFDLPYDDTQALLVAGGIGIAPLLFTARKLMQKGVTGVKLFFGGATNDDLPSLDRFGRFDVKNYIATEDGSFGTKGFVTALLDKALQTGFVRDPKIFACGPPPMLEAVSNLAEKYSVPCQVSLENIMACGVGSCLGCVTEVIDCDGKEGNGHCYERVCAEGPVFDSSAISWRKEKS